MTIIWAALLLVQGLLPAVTVYLTKPLVDSLVHAVASRSDLDAVFRWGGLMAAAMLLTEILQKLIALVRRYQSEILSDHISGLIYRKSIEADYAFYDLPEYYDHLHRARQDASYRPEMLLESLGSLLQNTITLAAIGALIFAYGWWLPAILLLSTLPALLVVLNSTLKQYAWQKKTTPDQRRLWYYDWLLTSNETAAEIRLFDLGQHFKSAWHTLRYRLRNEQLDLARSQYLYETLASSFALSITLAALAWMILRAYEGLITLGILALFYQGMNRGQGLMRGMLDNVGRIYSNSLFLGNLFEFLGLEARVVDGAGGGGGKLERGIRIEGISFRYPGSERRVFDDFWLEVPAGKVVAIVGLNGAGKSTLLKLLCRLYDVDLGRILFDGVDVRDMKLGDLRRMITVLFQSPVHFKQRAGESIGLGDLELRDDRGAIEAAAREAGADEIVRGLPEGYENMLGRWFEGGAELSVGQWQRIALARAFLRKAPIILLDEPTSAMDSWAEAEWMGRFRGLARGRTAIIITHRFTTAMQADEIHVMIDGRVVESGTHRDLVGRGGYYAKSWESQTLGKN